jgi:hypothetical protein
MFTPYARTPKPRKPLKTLRDSALISFTEYKRIKDDSIYLTEIERIEKKKREEELLQKSLFKSINLKKRIINYDETHTRPELKSDFDIENEKRNILILENAKKIKEKEDDFVKSMDKMIQYAKMATIRDRQIEDKKRIEEIYKKKDEKLDIISEIERLKELKIRSEKEDDIKKKRREGAIVIINQIKFNEIERKKKEKEIIENEKKEILKQVEKNKIEEEKILKEKKESGEKLLSYIIESNKLYKKQKEENRKKELEFDLQLEKYNKIKREKEEEENRKKKLEKEKKELELQKIRQNQIKNVDIKSSIDDIRMKRYFEENDRIARKKEIEENERKKLQMKDLMESNKKLIEAKQLILAKEAENEKKEFYKILNDEIKEIEKRKEDERKFKEKMMRHNRNILEEIMKREELKKLEQREILEEGRKIKQDNEEYLKNIYDIKKRKIDDLKKMEIKPLYMIDLLNFKPMI